MSDTQATEGRIRVPAAVLEGLEAVRDFGLVNMVDARGVTEVAQDMRFPGTAAWITYERKRYAAGVFRGFEASESQQPGEYDSAGRGAAGTVGE